MFEKFFKNNDNIDFSMDDNDLDILQSSDDDGFVDIIITQGSSYACNWSGSYGYNCK